MYVAENKRETKKKRKKERRVYTDLFGLIMLDELESDEDFIVGVVVSNDERC